MDGENSPKFIVPDFDLRGAQSTSMESRGSETCKVQMKNSSPGADRLRDLSEMSIACSGGQKVGDHKRCRIFECKKFARGNTGLCVKHGGGKRCTYEGCTKSARDSLSLCIAHGGGKRCVVRDCPKSAIWGSDTCIAHGGSRRCKGIGCLHTGTGYKAPCNASRGTRHGRASESISCEQENLLAVNFQQDMDAFSTIVSAEPLANNGSTACVEMDQYICQGLGWPEMDSIRQERSAYELLERQNIHTMREFSMKRSRDIIRYGSGMQQNCSLVPRTTGTWWDSDELELPEPEVPISPSVDASFNALTSRTSAKTDCSKGCQAHEMRDISFQFMRIPFSNRVCRRQHPVCRHCTHSDNERSTLPITNAPTSTTSRNEFIDTVMCSKVNLTIENEQLSWGNECSAKPKQTIWDDQFGEWTSCEGDHANMMYMSLLGDAALDFDIPDEGSWKHQYTTNPVFADFHPCEREHMCNNRCDITNRMMSKRYEAAGSNLPCMTDLQDMSCGFQACTTNLDNDSGLPCDMRCALALDAAASKWDGLQGEVTSSMTFEDYSAQMFFHNEGADAACISPACEEVTGQNAWSTCCDSGYSTHMCAFPPPYNIETF